MENSVSPSVGLKKIINNLFRNQKIYNNTKYTKISISAAKLSDTQISQIVYPENSIPLNIFLFYQTDKYDEQQLISSIPQLAVLSMDINSKYIYGVYYTLSNQPRFRTKYLVCTDEPILLDVGAVLIPGTYIETYIMIGDRVTAFSTDSSDSSSSVQYSICDLYFSSYMTPNGLLETYSPKIQLTSLSRNLHFDNSHCGNIHNIKYDHC